VRIKDKTFAFHLTTGQYNAIKSKAKRAKMTMTDYLVNCALEKQICVVDDLKPMVSELKAIGRNLNQLTTISHLGRINCINLTEATAKLDAIYEALFALSKRES
jgi:hypothetical protein